jgi:hypothetical protein
MAKILFNVLYVCFSKEIMFVSIHVFTCVVWYRLNLEMKLLSLMKKLSFATNRLQLKLSFVTIIFSNDVYKQHILVMQTIILVTNNSFSIGVF